MSLSRILMVFFLLLSVSLTAQVSPPPPPDSVKVNYKVFIQVEEEAYYTADDTAWRKYLIRNLNPNVPVDNDAPAGRYTVIVKFIVSKDGSLSDIACENDPGFGMCGEVIRPIKKSKNWQPAVQNKRAVNAYRRQRVTFLVEYADFKIQSEVPYTFFTATDNKIHIQAGKVKNKKLSVSISSGTITSTGDDQYIVRVDKPGRVTLTLYKKRSNKKIGAASFEVKTKN